MAAQTMRQQLTEHIEKALAELQSDGYLTSDPPRFALSPPKQESHGDYACTVALALAKPMKKNPREIAGKLQEALGNAGGLLEKTEIAGPGYLNMFVARSAWHKTLAGILEQGDDFIRSEHGGGKKILVEFVSANPTGPLHIAHGRGAVAGDVIANLLDAAGYNVEREYYVNDLGHQADTFARSIHLRYRELQGKDFEKPEDFYPGDYVIEIAETLQQEFGARYLDEPEDVWLSTFRDRGIALMLERIREDLDGFGVRFDRWTSERELTARVGLDKTLDQLKNSGHLFEEEGKRWFRTTDFGDDKDRVVVRDDGRPTYFASDIAYHNDKMERGFEKLINIWGADHGGYVTRVRAGLQALGHAKDSLEVILIQMVSLSRGGDSVRMGKRLGTAVWLRDVVQEAGRDATRYFFAMRRSEAQLDFDIELATKKSLDNPVYYAQMGHARICSIATRAAEAGIPRPTYQKGALDPLCLPEEIGLIKTMDRAPELVADAADKREPHLVVHYLQDLIAQFHSYYTQYKNTERVISDDADKSRARLLLCQALARTLRALLGILGVDSPERMFLEEREAGVEAE